MDGVKATRSFFCSNPRDHILGILGHASDVEKDSIISQDNLYSLSVQECYLRFARSQLLEKHNFAVLALAPQKLITDALAPWYLRPYIRWQKRRLPGLPSWVPDLRNQEIDTLPSYTVRYGKFSAGGATPGRVEIVDDKILKCTDHLKTMIKGMEVWLNSEDVEEAERARVRPTGAGMYEVVGDAYRGLI
ncbi:hypothetical protein COL940_008561 [Colletotrichum noveboracense]|nr:hypothetical protein COL940_008561 [Colletotrichum noveboracense]KAJ0283205.1 hypothetical protein CBS470a_007445 [Colletotrichum nupharicola]